MIEVFFIKSLDNSYFEKTYQSFTDTISQEAQSDFEIKTVDELETREETLNKILEIRQKEHHLLIVSDDIIFTNGWYKNLRKNFNNGDIIGFSTTKFGQDKLSNRGFQFVKIGRKLTYSPLNKGEEFKVSEKGFVECDFVTGCLMFVNNYVLEHNFTFPKEGFNRWGEILFMAKAKQKGFRVICLKQTVYHEGISTKNKSEKYSSISYLIEQDLWNIACSKYLGNVKPNREIKVEVGIKLKKLLESKEKKLIYGCGTVCDYILTSCNFQNLTLVSGLKEEHGLKFHGLKVLDIKRTDLKSFKHIINTAIGYEKEVKTKYFNDSPMLVLEKKENRNSMTIELS